jgi:tRNA threonylcarbamoyladenosine biosynthesis protein TsaE
MEVITKNKEETKKLGEKFARLIISGKLKKRILALEGELGGGKTTFLKGFAKGLKIKGKILSPTFVIFRKFKVKNKKFKNFYHIDCYRIKNPKDLLKLGFKRIIQSSQNIVAIEWADKIRKILPQNALRINFEILNLKRRKITLEDFKIERFSYN